MAELRFYENLFEDEYKSVKAETGKTVTEAIALSGEDVYSSYMVECYDTETGRTFYAPLSEDSDSVSVLVTVNNREVTDGYIIGSDDIIKVVYLPSGGSINWANFWMSGIQGALSGALFGGSVGSPWGILIGGVAGFITGAGTSMIMDQIQYHLQGSSSSGNGYDTGKEGESLPDVRGAENQSIVGNQFPYLFGKHLITPFVAGSPYTEYSEDGKDAYIRILLCAGYAPLKLTDFKLGDTWLAYNRTQGNVRDTVLHGKLKGYSTVSADDGDILDYWKNNEIEIEILQQKDRNSIDFGTIYERKVVEQEVKATPLYVTDKELSDLARVTYKGTSFPDKFRNNTVRFTESCPRKFTVILDAQQGLYSTYSDEGNTKYGSIPLWYAIQWRFYDKNNSSSDSNGSDYYKWNNITKWNGRELGSVYTATAEEEDIKAHKGNTLDISEQKTNNIQYLPVNLSNINSLDAGYISNSGVKFGDWASNPNYIISRNGASKKISNSKRYDCYFGEITLSNGITTTAVINSRTEELYLSIKGSNVQNTNADTSVKRVENLSSFKTTALGEQVYVTLKKAYQGGSEDYSVGTITLVVSTIFTDFTIIEDFCTLLSSNGSWQGKTLTNFQPFTGEDYISEQRFSATVELTDEQCAQALNSDNTIKSIEVRMIRISPCYLNMTKSISDSKGPESYSDVIQWLTLLTEPFDEDKYNAGAGVVPVRPLSDELMYKQCLIAVKAKADSTGNISQQLKKINCIAESFAPYYDTAEHKWIPESVSRKTGYYRPYYDESGKFMSWISCNKEEYEKARQAGNTSYTRVREGTDFDEKIRELIFTMYDENRKRWIFDFDTSVFNTANAASMFLLSCIGSQNGPAAIGYDKLNMLSLAEWYEKLEDITDGSTYDKAGSDEFGWHEKGDLVHYKFRANGYIYNAKKLEDILKNIAVCGRAVYTYDEAGRIKIVFDEKSDYPVGVINQMNSMTPSNTYSYSDLPAGLQFTFSDENDGYEKNTFYCWSDNNSLESHKGSVDGYSLEYVTDPKQMWSLGRYVLACRLLQKEILTRKIGMEGNLFSIGDVVLVQSDELLIGGGSGRIKQLIEDDSGIYGFVCDAPYRYTAEVDENGLIKQGVTILQPGKYGQSRTVTLRLREPGTISVLGEEYRLEKGMTNLILLENRIERSVSAYAPTSSLKYDFRNGDIVLYGEISKISQKYRITKIKPDKDRNFTLTLVPYFDELYSYGKELPSFQPVMSMPPAENDPFTLSESPSSLSELQTYIDAGNMVTMAKIASLYANHIVTLYKDTTERLTSTGITSASTYRFSDNHFEWQSESGSNGWSTEYPSEPTGTVYVTTATAFGKETSDTIEPSEWASPIPAGQNGENGYNTATITLYRRKSQIDETNEMPHRIIYHFNKGDTISNITGDGESKDAALNGWQETIPEITEDKFPVWAVTATALSTTLTDTIETSEWSSPKRITQDGLTVDDVKELITGVSAPPVTYIDIKQFGIAVNSEGIVTKEQSITCTVTVRQTDEELEFEFGEILCPEGITYTTFGNQITFRAEEGTRIKFGVIPIKVNFYPYLSNVVITAQREGEVQTPVGIFCPESAFAGRIASVDALPEVEDGGYITWTGIDTESELSAEGMFTEGTSYVYSSLDAKWHEPEYGSLGYYNKSPDPTEFDLTVEYLPVRGGIYRGAVSSIDELPQADDLIIGDYIVWISDDVVSNLTDTGWFTTAGRYQWNGYKWEKDYNAQHMAGSLNDVLSIKDELLADIDEKSEKYADIEYFKKLAAKEIFVGTLVASEIFADRLAATQISVKTGNGGCIVSDNFSLADGTGIKIDFDKGTIYAPQLVVGKSGEEDTDITKALEDNLEVSKSYADTVGSGAAISTQTVYFKTKSSSVSAPVGSTGIYADDRTDGWTTAIPSYADGYNYYTSIQVRRYDYTNKKDVYEYSSPTIDNDLFKYYAVKNGKTIITGGYIKTELLEASAVLAKMMEVKQTFIVGRDLQNNTDVAIKSSNWTGTNSTTGFGILKDGSAYFNSGTFRGYIYAEGGDFSGVCKVDKLHFDKTYSQTDTGFSNGDIWMVSI